MTSSQEALRDELAKLQQQVNSLGTGDLAEAVAKLQDQVEKVARSAEDAASSSSSVAAAAGYDASKVGGRQKIGADDMSAEVVDTNPYSRLMALQRMGIVSEVRGRRRRRCWRFIPDTRLYSYDLSLFTTLRPPSSRRSLRPLGFSTHLISPFWPGGLCVGGKPASTHATR